MSAHQLALRELRRTSSRFRLLVAAVAVLSFLVVLQQALLTGLVGQLNGGLRFSDADLYVLGDSADGAGSVRFGTAAVMIGGREADVSLVGIDPGRPGGPAALAGGRSVERDTEVVASADAGAGGDLRTARPRVSSRAGNRSRSWGWAKTPTSTSLRRCTCPARRSWTSCATSVPQHCARRRARRLP
jgi:hypothetical protein